MSKAMVLLTSVLILSACSKQAPVDPPTAEQPPDSHFAVELSMPFEDCLIVRPLGMTTDRYCEGEGWIEFPDDLQYCGDSTIYYQNDNGKVAICASPDCDLTWEQQRTLYLWAAGTEDQLSD